MELPGSNKSTVIKENKNHPLFSYQVKYYLILFIAL